MDRRGFMIGSAAAGASILLGSPGGAAALIAPPKGAGAGGSDLARLDATGQAALVRSRAVSPAELVEGAIIRLQALNPVLNVLVTPLYERALAAARKPVGSGPFAGVPFLIKDVADYEGVRRTSGSRSLAGNISERTGEYIRAMESSGLLAIGKSTTPEFALIPTTEPVLTGKTRNPWNLEYSTSGSSGGSAAAVAAGIVPIAHATDGGGSIRNPAGACGLFGLKATNGRPVGATGRGSTGAIGVNGCVSRSVRDSAALLAATEQRGGKAPWAPVGLVAGPSRRRLRIGLSTTNLYGRDAEPDVRRAVNATARLCESLGHRVEPAKVPVDGEQFIRQFLVIYGAGAAAPVEEYRKRTGRAPDESVMEPFTLRMAEDHAKVPASAMPAALAYLVQVEKAMDAFFQRYDVLLTPVTRTPPPKLGYIAPTGRYETVLERVIDYASYTPLQNAASLPAMSVPLGWTAAGLPIGSHFSARMGAERTLLELAYELEAARPWAARWPTHNALKS